MKRMKAGFLILVILLFMGCNRAGASESPVILPEEESIDIFRTTEETAREFGGVFLLRDGVYYTLSECFREMPNIDYPTNMRISDVNNAPDEDFVEYYMPIDQNHYMAYSKIPIPVVEDGDQIVCFYNTDIPMLELFYVDSITYSLPLDDQMNVYYYEGGTFRHLGTKLDKIKITNEKRKKVENFHDMAYGDVCRLSWKERGVLSQKIELTVNSKYIEVDRSHDNTRNGIKIGKKVVKYDLAGLDSGVYQIRTNTNLPSGGFIEIK